MRAEFKFENSGVRGIGYGKVFMRFRREDEMFGF